MIRVLVFVWLASVGTLAQAGEALSPLAWLQKISDATRQLDYNGTFVFQQGDHVETARILHRVEGGESLEKFETLDGRPREIIRVGDQVFCYTADARSLKVERRPGARLFPRVLPKDTAPLAEVYTVRFGEPLRVAGQDCVALLLEPKDALRFGHRLWAAADSGLLLKSAMVDNRGHTLTQVSFTQVSIGEAPDRAAFRSELLAKGGRLAEVRDGAENLPAVETWQLEPMPPGFRKTREMKRTLPGKSHPVFHVVLSDGLATVSVFVEPAATAQGGSGPSVQGLINLYSTRSGDYYVTALGEVPPATVKSMALSLVLKAKGP